MADNKKTLKSSLRKNAQIKKDFVLLNHGKIKIMDDNLKGVPPYAPDSDEQVEKRFRNIMSAERLKQMDQSTYGLSNGNYLP